MTSLFRLLAITLLPASLSILQACASTDAQESTEPPLDTGIEPTVVSVADYNDPLISLNRAVYAFNDFSYRYALIPLSNGYLAVVPGPVRTGIDNVFSNIKTPIHAVNNLLQGRPERSLGSIARFGINTTVGLLGIFDPALYWFDLQPSPTLLTDTLAQWGSGYGMFLMLPLIGPSDLRNGVGRIGDYFMNPIVYLTDNPERLLLQGLDGLNTFAPLSDSYLELQAQADDPYLYFRNMYLQGIVRDAEFQNEP